MSDNYSLKFMFKKIDEDRIEIDGNVYFVKDIVATMVATMGTDWLFGLTAGHSELATALHNQNLGDVGTELYAQTNPQLGYQLEDLCGRITRKLLDVRDNIQEQPLRTTESEILPVIKNK